MHPNIILFDKYYNQMLVHEDKAFNITFTGKKTKYEEFILER